MCPILITPAAWARASEIGARASDAVPAASVTNRRRVIALAGALVRWNGAGILFITEHPQFALAGVPMPEARRRRPIGSAAMIGDILAGAKECTQSGRQ